MNRDAKIGIVVILIIVGVLFVIWGRQPKDTTTGGDGSPVQDSVITSLTNNTVAQPPAGTGSGTGGAPAIPTEILQTPPVGPVVTPPTGPVTPPPASALTEYVVRPGDVLEKIATEQLGDRSRMDEIIKLNNLTNPDKLQIGQKLKLPAKGSAPASVEPGVSGASGEGTTEAPAGTEEPVVVTRRDGLPSAPIPGLTTRTAAGTTAGSASKYTVKAGDNGLIQIAREQLGDATRWKKIAELNGLAEPYALQVGQVLVMPE